MTATAAELETATATATATANREAHREAVQTQTGARARRARPRVAVGPAVRKIATLWDPPELWSERQESLRDVWNYARHGEWTGEHTAGRLLGQGYALLVALPGLFVGHLLLWILRRPGRSLTVAAVLVPAALTPAGEAVRAWIAISLRWLAGLIT